MHHYCTISVVRPPSYWWAAWFLLCCRHYSAQRWSFLHISIWKDLGIYQLWLGSRAFKLAPMSTFLDPDLKREFFQCMHCLSIFLFCAYHFLSFMARCTFVTNPRWCLINETSVQFRWDYFQSLQPSHTVWCNSSCTALYRDRKWAILHAHQAVSSCEVHKTTVSYRVAACVCLIINLMLTFSSVIVVP